MTTSRRNFVKTFAAGTIGATIGIPAVSYARILGANERVNIGVIGTGRQAYGHIRGFHSEHDARIVALCDVYQPVLDHAAAAVPDAATYGDFRRIIDRSDIDAVVVSTPDHWHAIPTVMACDAGKDVYVEKPTARTIAESRKMVEAARRNNRIVQVGTQQRSAPHFQQAADIVRNGGIGRVTFVRTWNYSNSYPNGMGNPPDTAPPPGLDWEMWLGPAPQVPFNINRFGVVLDEQMNYDRWPSWRYFWDYAGGMMTDWGVHLLDIVHWAMGDDTPQSVAAIGGTFGLDDNRTTPDTLQTTYRYSDFVCVYENRQASSRPLDGHGYGISFHGSDATLFVDRGGFEIIPEPNRTVEAVKVAQVPEVKSHRRDFLDSIKSRDLPICDIETGHRSSAAAMLGNVAFRSGRRIEWDGEAELVRNDPEANSYVSYDYRGPWAL